MQGPNFGIIFAGWRCHDMVAHALGPWLSARAGSCRAASFRIAAVCCPFQGFCGEDDGTLAYLQGRLASGEIDHLATSATPLSEVEARGRALSALLGMGVTDIWQADADEFILPEQIDRIVGFWANRPHLGWARLSYKNRVFTPNQYLVKPFTPPRIHRAEVPHRGFRASHFWDDNNIMYRALARAEAVRDLDFPSVTVPTAVAWIDHHTWISNDRSRMKCQYQSSRPGWRCDFAWDDARGGLVWRDGIAPPETAFD